MKFSRVAAAALLTAALAITLPQTASAAQNSAVRDYPVFSMGCFATTPLPLGQTVTAHLTSGGLDRSYLIHLPAGYQPHNLTSLVMAFHGRKGDGKDIEAFSGIDALNAIAVYPVGAPGEDGQTAWQSAPYAAPGVDDVRFVSDLLDHLQSTLCVDPNRIYATGKSNGGGFTALLACQLPDRIAAFATVAGAFYPGTTQGCATSPPVPLVDFHGTADPIIDYNGGTSHDTPIPAMADWVQGWADHNRCTTETTTSIGSDVTELAWSGCAGNAPIDHYRVAGAGHTWPGELVDSGPGSATHTISATQVMWQFFTAHTLLARWF
jgi:polyhydroxybutyrate depolymerase